MQNMVYQLMQRIRRLEERVDYLIRLVDDYRQALQQYKQKAEREGD